MSKSKFSHKVIAVFLTLNFLTTIIPVNHLFANNNGPNAPEASGFEPVNATDMVNLSSGDMSYVLPLLEVDGFPVTLSYHAGIPMDMEASWVGLGWNINTGAIARGVVANPDDWGLGRRLNLTYLYGEIDSYSVNVGVGISKAAEVGVGLSWGSNKSISGSVSATIGPASASIDTNGNYSVGISANIGKAFGFGEVFDKIDQGKTSGDKLFGGSLSISGNIKKGGIAANIGVGGSANGMSAGMGVSISSNGLGSSFSVGANNKTSGDKARGTGAGISMNSFSAGDYSYNTKGFYIPINIGIFNFGFGHQKTKIDLAKGYNKYGYGILYHNKNTGTILDKLYNSDLGQDVLPSAFNTNYDDYQRRNVYGDVYEQQLPQSEIEFIGDYRQQVEKLNFTFGGYDSYDINASGLGGSLRPIVGENSVLIGEGYDGESVRADRDKTKVFYHNSGQNMRPNKSISLSDPNPNKLNFSFDGQITEDAIVTGSSINNYSGSTLNISNFITQGNSLSSRPKSGSFVETFTNSQIDAGADILIPASLKTDTGSTSRVNAGYMMDGIGGYKITTPDGKTYHFAQPVYHYEQVQHNFLNFDADNTSKYNSSSKREATPYSTHWLLTAITGPDFIDLNGNKFADENDYGYWLRLDHGQWSNAFAWRSPYDYKEYTSDSNLIIPNQSRKHYSTFKDHEAERSDPGYFIQGRKDLYYLDKIVSRNQTAVFVKDIRYDAYGTSADYIFNPTNINNSFWQPIPTQAFMFNDPIESGNINSKEHAKYDKEYQLKLDKILIINKKESEINIDKTYGNGLAGLSETVLTNRYYGGGFFDVELPQATKTHKLHLSENVIDINDIQNFNYEDAVKVLKFNHSYDLARKSPSSGYINDSNGDYPDCPNNSIENKHYGRLTLESVQTFGRNMLDYMPPYKFEYKDKTLQHEVNQIVQVPGSQLNLSFPFSSIAQFKLDRANKDNWGFRNQYNGPDNDSDGIPDNNTVDAWSLNKITTPQGATIEVKYEEDDFYIEAFGRRYWENNLKFQILRNSDNNNILIQIANHESVNPNLQTNFLDYFELGQEVFIDVYICRTRHAHSNSSDRGSIDINSNTYNHLIEYPKVHSVTENVLVIRLDNIPNIANVIGGNDTNRVFGPWFSKNNAGGTNIYEGTQRNCPVGVPAGGDHHKMVYKLLANKAAPGKSGGGLRVKDVIVNDDLGGKFITRYDYNNPETGKTSGITSFNPIRGEVFVPYQNELPGPGVMYEWVTMKAIQMDLFNNEKEIGSTRYHYYTLQPIFDIFNPNLDMKDIDDHSIFKTVVTQPSMSFNKLTARDIKIEKDLSKIGQLISIEEFNELGHLMSKTTNEFAPRIGELSETFSSMKTVFDFDENDDHDEYNYRLNQHYLSLSTKSEKISVINSIQNITTAGNSTVTYSEPDEYLGTFTASTKTLANGNKIREKKIPAYKKYPLMGPKTSDITNKNMLTQEAMNITSWSPNFYSSNSGYPLNASITTWDNDWTYRDYAGNETNESNIWRKEKSFVWKGEVHSEDGHFTDGEDNYIYILSSSDDKFDWTNGEPFDDRWQNTSEITRYTHWSEPIEFKDINGNFASSKMADDDSKVVASGNASYGKMFYSGAEYDIDGVYLDKEIKGAQFRSTDFSHTGKYALKLSAGDKGFETQFNANEHTKDNYKISVWAYKTARGLELNIDGVSKGFNGERVQAGDWTLYNHYEYIDNSTSNIFVTTLYNNTYVDDFRIHPVYASMNSYVYDENKDELNYILDNNNMATKYVYDDAGRLCKLYKEVETHYPETDGGFKLINQYRYNYKGNTNSGGCDCCEGEGQSSNNGFSPMVVKSLSEVDKGAYNRVFRGDVHGGSGNYTYQWRWLTDFDSNTYSNYVIGSDKQEAPFAIKQCDIKANTFNKIWIVELKITDITTGEVVTKNEKIELSGCKNVLSDSKWADLEISSNYDPCSVLTNFTFRPYVVKPTHNNYSYLYQTYNHASNQWSGYNNITNQDKKFCPESYFAPSNECKTEYSVYQTIRYRVVDNETGSVFQSNIIDVYLDCVEDLNSGLLLPASDYHDKFNTYGNVVEKLDSGEIINSFKFTDKINNKN